MADTSRKLGIVFASAEAAPFVKTGGLGDVAGSLPAALSAAGADVIVMVPRYETIADEYKEQMEHLCDFYVPLGWRNEYCGLERLVKDGVTYLFIDNKRYFDRSYPYGFFDDGERFAFFSKAICESLQHLPEGFTCDILHCNDWHTALAPVFLREFYQGLPLYENVKTIFSIHNIAFQGQFTDKLLEDILGLAHIPAAASQLRCDEHSINYMMGALNYADAITTVSPTYAAEIQTPAFGEHLDGVLRRRSEALQGILNGIDTKKFDPATDPAIAANYSAHDRSGKAACKKALQEELGLVVRDDQPLMVMVTRLTRQKGLDLVTYALDRILSGGVQVAVLGTGDADYENALRYFEGKYPGQMAARIQFDPALSQRMYAGADLFLMPSLFEPCGLSQIIAMRYGTLPVVRETGGLKDTVIPYNYETGEGTGFSFANFNGEEMGDAVFRAARLFWDDREAFDRVVRQAMEQDFSWKKSAEKYLDLYCWMHPELPRPVSAEEAARLETEAKAEAEAAEAEKKAEAVAEAEAAKKAAAEAKAEVEKRAGAKRAAEAAAVKAKAEAEKKAAAEKAAAEKAAAEAKAVAEAEKKAEADKKAAAARERAEKEALKKAAAAAKANAEAEKKAAAAKAEAERKAAAAAKAEAEKKAAAAAKAKAEAEAKAKAEAEAKAAAAAEREKVESTNAEAAAAAAQELQSAAKTESETASKTATRKSATKAASTRKTAAAKKTSTRAASTSRTRKTTSSKTSTSSTSHAKPTAVKKAEEAASATTASAAASKSPTRKTAATKTTATAAKTSTAKTTTSAAKATETEAATAATKTASAAKAAAKTASAKASAGKTATEAASKTAAETSSQKAPTKRVSSARTTSTAKRTTTRRKRS